MTTPIERVLAKLPSAVPSGDRWKALCPAHDDRNPSLSVREADDGRALVHCHAGCKADAVLAALGMKYPDLLPVGDDFAPPGASKRAASGSKAAPKAPRNGRIVATYDYRDESGKLVFQAVRYEPKAFRQRRPDGRGGWTWNVKGCRVLPYRLPELLSAVAERPDRIIFICEGEKDADSLTTLGVFATCNACGAGKWTDKHAAVLRDCVVVILPDNDEPGRDHARKVAASLQGVAKSIRIVELPDLPEKGDVCDWIAAGGTKDALAELVRQAPFWIASSRSTGTKAGSSPPTHDEPPEGERPDADRAFDPFGGVEITTDRPVPATLARLTAELRPSNDCFVRAEQFVVIRNDGTVRPILSSAEFSGLVAERVHVYKIRIVDDEPKPSYVPLPTPYASDWMHGSQRNSFPEVRTFTRNPVYVIEGDAFGDARLIATPGFDAPSGIYYAGPIVEPRAGTACLDALLSGFCFRTEGDRSNYVGVLLTAVLMPRFIGSHPAALFNGNQPGLGKSILAQMLSIVRDGRTCETLTYNPNDEEFEKRLGAAIRSAPGVVVVDNAKARGRNGRIESPCLERSITDEWLSYRLLMRSDTIRMENSVQFCITANASDVSRDLITRSIVVDLLYEGDPSRRRFQIDDPEGYATANRSELLAELLGMVERWKAAGTPLAGTDSRFNKRGWGNVVGGILTTNGREGFLANANEAAATLDETRRDFAHLVADLADHPQGAWTAAELVERCDAECLLRADLGDGSSRSRATRIGTLAGRFVGEGFDLMDGRIATFNRARGRKGAVYRVEIESKEDDATDLESFPP